MGRPRLTNPRTEHGSVRLTKNEVEHLVETYGSIPRGLRHLVERSLLEHRGHATVVSVDEPAKAHRHRRGEELEPVYEGGSKKRRFACADPDCEEVLS